MNREDDPDLARYLKIIDERDRVKEQKRQKFDEVAQRLLNDGVDFCTLEEHDEQGRPTALFSTREISFDDLSKLSQVLGTRLINLSPLEDGCPTCGTTVEISILVRYEC